MILSGSGSLGDSRCYMYSTASQSADEADLQQEATEQAQAVNVPFATTQSPAPALYVSM
jgi:hypothetical protein